MDPIEALGDLQLSRVEESQLRLNRAESEDARTLVEVGLALAAAFLLHRSYVARKTKQMLPGQPSSALVQAIAMQNARAFTPAAVYMITPALETALAYGQVRSEAPNVPDEVIQEFAQDYARNISHYFNDTSGEALADGFNGFVNKKIAAKAAAEKALDGYGLNRRQMRSVLTRLVPGKISSIQELDLDHDRHAQIERMLVDRMYDLGDTESYNVSQQGQQLAWLYNHRLGRLPADTRRVWLTAEDEKVCPVCGPLDNARVAVDEPFQSPYGKIWMPTLHPNCRCDVRLWIPRGERIAKDLYGGRLADFNEDHPRQHDGRFRTKKHEVRTVERPVDPTLERLLREAQSPPRPQEPQSPPAEGLGLGEGLNLGQKLGLGSGLNLGSLNLSLNLSAIGQQQEMKLEQPTLSLGSLKLDDLKLSEQELEGLKLTALAPAQINLAAPRPATPRAREETIGLPDTMFFLDPSGFHHYDENMHLHESGEYASFGHDDEFTTRENLYDQIGTMYTEEINREVRRVINQGRNWAMIDGERRVLDADTLRGAFIAEITNSNNVPVLRDLAQQFGVKRADYTVVVYRLDEAYANGFEGDTLAFGETEFSKVPGTYRVDEEIPYTGQGWPLIIRFLEPE